MNIFFSCNIDHYKSSHFDNTMTQVPRVGETVLVSHEYLYYFKSRKLPLRLEVVDVVWSGNTVVCELWYKKNDVDSAKLSGVNLF